VKSELVLWLWNARFFLALWFLLCFVHCYFVLLFYCYTFTLVVVYCWSIALLFICDYSLLLLFVSGWSLVQLLVYHYSFALLHWSIIIPFLIICGYSFALLLVLCAPLHYYYTIVTISTSGAMFDHVPIGFVIVVLLCCCSISVPFVWLIFIPHLLVWVVAMECGIQLISFINLNNKH
jgi:hypothetical protein